MRLLLDTCCWLWWLSDTQKLSEQQLNALISRQNQLFLSVATLWELSIKISNGKLTIPQSLDKLVAKECPQDNIKILDIKPIHGINAGSLPLHHKDPFDRMIITQGNMENLTIVTSDAIFQEYDISVLL
ncbi:MAG: type II toxin-antitoxin system VapC family toxin [Pleurocapsa sp. MO_226.B13]|nr:type II toxin-antitoxin system VapC family toxin [Pleurocapsa sp. MO_226.B13]